MGRSGGKRGEARGSGEKRGEAERSGEKQGEAGRSGEKRAVLSRVQIVIENLLVRDTRCGVSHLQQHQLACWWAGAEPTLRRGSLANY